MSKPTDLTAKIKFIFEVDAAAGVAQLAQVEGGIRGVNIQIGELTIVNEAAKQATSTYGTSIRGLLLNLRMFSFAVRTLRREFGDTNPVVEEISSNLITLAAMATGIAAAWDIAKKAQEAFKSSTNVIITSIKGLITTLGAWKVAAIALGLLALPMVIKGVYEWTSGITRLKQEIKDAETDLRMMEASLDRLNLTQERFNLGMSQTALSIMRLKRAIDLQQSGTEALEAQYETLNAEMLNQQIIQAELGIQQQQQNLVTKEATELAEDYARQIEAIRISGRVVGAAGMAVTQERVLEALRAMGWTEEMGRVPRGQLLRTIQEQNAAGINPRGGGANVTINFPNALFQTVEGVREAILGAAREAADIIRFNQYAEPGNQR